MPNTTHYGRANESTEHIVFVFPLLLRAPRSWWAGCRVGGWINTHAITGDTQIGDTLFVHGGLRPVNLDPKHCGGATGLACLENLNR